MTSREKAEELITKFMPHSSGNSNNNEAKECALIAANEIIRFINREGNLASFLYWQQVKKEIEKV
jgi:hypothetical protein